MKLRKKIGLFLIVFFALHAMTWWLWGTDRLLVKGYEYLEKNESCQQQFSVMTYNEVYEDSLYNYIGEKLWVLDFDNIDSISTIVIGGEEIVMYRDETKKVEILIDEMYSSDIYYLQMYIGKKYPNPYFQKATFDCWAFGSDWTEDHVPYLIWVFFGWIEITNEKTLANLVNKYRD